MTADWPGRAVILAGPSGAGKTTICGDLLHDPRFRLSVSVTTRASRRGEQDGVHYRFVEDSEFERMVQAREFLEFAEVFGFRYGTPAEAVRAWMREGLVPLMDIDVQGTRYVRGVGLPGVYILLCPPSLEELRRRLDRRGMDSDVIQRRLARAQDEMQQTELFDHVVVNDDLSATKRKIRGILAAEGILSADSPLAPGDGG